MRIQRPFDAGFLTKRKTLGNRNALALFQGVG